LRVTGTRKVLSNFSNASLAPATILAFFAARAAFCLADADAEDARGWPPAAEDACGSLCLARDDAADDADAEDARGWPPAAEDASGSLLPATSPDDGCLVFDH